jgi:acyl-coenzyme A synthetase/AMP-(fatty) acid ligase
VVSPVDGKPCAVNEKGIMTIKRPFPGLTPALWAEPERYASDYWQILPGVYYTGDSAQIDEVIKIAGHRIGKIEVETAFLKHPAVAETGVIGRPDELRGEVISSFVVLKQDYSYTEDLRRELIETVRQELGFSAPSRWDANPEMFRQLRMKVRLIRPEKHGESGEATWQVARSRLNKKTHRRAAEFAESAEKLTYFLAFPASSAALR